MFHVNLQWRTPQVTIQLEKHHKNAHAFFPLGTECATAIQAQMKSKVTGTFWVVHDTLEESLSLEVQVDYICICIYIYILNGLERQHCFSVRVDFINNSRVDYSALIVGFHFKTGPGANFISTIHRPVGNSPHMVAVSE